MIGAKPYGQRRYRSVNGKRMAYADEGRGDTIVFQHGNPTSSYLWRNVMPHLQGLGRLVACDLIGMGGSDKLHASGAVSISPTRINSRRAGSRAHVHAAYTKRPFPARWPPQNLR